MEIYKTRLDELSACLAGMPEVQSVTPYGSYVTGQVDEFSDIDLAIDVSGFDNGQFLLTLPMRLAEHYPILFTDFAPSLAPEKYVLTAAIYPDKPFLLLDISVTATPHCSTVTREMLSGKNNPFAHTLKLFSANMKHYLREQDCGSDIRKMYGRLAQPDTDSLPEMLRHTHRWLLRNASADLREYIDRFTPYLTKIQ